MERSDWFVRKLVRMERYDWLVWKVVRMEQYDWMVRLLGPEGAIRLVVPEICLRAPSIDFLSYKTSDSSVADNKKTIREMRLVLQQNFRSPCRCTQQKQTTVSFYVLLNLPGGVTLLWNMLFCGAWLVIIVRMCSTSVVIIIHRLESCGDTLLLHYSTRHT